MKHDHIGCEGGQAAEPAMKIPMLREHHGAPPVDVAELPVERRDGGGRQQIWP